MELSGNVSDKGASKLLPAGSYVRSGQWGGSGSVLDRMKGGPAVGQRVAFKEQEDPMARVECGWGGEEHSVA